MGNRLRVMDIVPGTSVDGPGLRTSVYFAGCAHHCEGCHNPQSWPFDAGKEMSEEDILNVIEDNGFNVTFSGGDPIYQATELYPLAKKIRDKGYTLWIYTGFLFEEIIRNNHAKRIIELAEVVVDGPFVQSLRDTSLLFRGSSNQRLIDVLASLKAGEIRLWHDGYINMI